MTRDRETAQFTIALTSKQLLAVVGGLAVVILAMTRRRRSR